MSIMENNSVRDRMFKNYFGSLGSPLSAQEISVDKTVITALKQENAFLRDRATALEVEIARLTRDLIAAKAPQAAHEALPSDESDRIWEALRMAATS